MQQVTQTRIGVLFPGQGSQEKGMGRDVAEADSQAMELWKKAEKISGVRLREIYWDGAEVEMARTEYLQPALTAVNLSLWMQLAGKLPGVGRELRLAGHSLGEYSALAAAEVLSIDAILELVCLRGKLMAAADPDGKGKMAALLKLTLEQVEELVAEAREKTQAELLVANYNSPGQFVISGAAAAVAACEPLVRERKGRSVPLPVSGAFHSPLMAEANRELVGYMSKLDWRKAKHPVYCNVSGAPTQDAGELKALLSKQMTSSVQWIKIIAAQWEDGVRTWREVGPKSVLTRLLKANLDGREGEWTGESVSGLEQAKAL
jgi:[acyl-carrier-protein] S-malonyltransferase